jgi:DNA-binding NarL/FixJ family response regulator
VLFGEALASLHAGAWPMLQGTLHLELARLELPRDRSAAVADASAALAIFQRIDERSAERAAALLESLGHRVSAARPAAHPLDVLTRREREVFDLVALGMSNPEIAKRLFITPKTAEHHVSSILGKLGLRGRAEVVVYAAAGAAAPAVQRSTVPMS